MNLKDEVYLNVAKELSRLSKDENTKVGAIIIDSVGREVSSGRNGTVSGFRDSHIPHSRELKELSYWENGEKKTFEANKYPFMLHAEHNAINFAADPSRLVGATLYCTHMPCSKCALTIAHHKIKRVVIPSSGYMAKCVDATEEHLTKFTFSQAGIQLQVGDGLVSLDACDPKLGEYRADI